MPKRAGRAVNDLQHPYDEAVTADHADGDQRPDAKGKNKKCQKLLAPARSRLLLSQVLWR